MDDAPIRARLMVRAGGLLMATLPLPEVASGMGDLLHRLREPLSPLLTSPLYFFFIRIDWSGVAHWTSDHGVAAAIFTTGLIILYRGSRKLERRLTRELART